MMKMTIEQLGVRIQKFFKDGIETTARQCKFVERASKLTGTKFLQALVFHSLERKEMTLSSIGQSCLDLGVRISGQESMSGSMRLRWRFCESFLSKPWSVFVWQSRSTLRF